MFILSEHFRGYPKTGPLEVKNARRKRQSMITTWSREIKIIHQKKLIEENKCSKKVLFESDSSDCDLDLAMTNNSDLNDFISDVEDVTTTATCVDIQSVENVMKDDCVLC